jgi:large subunit ribosomal protein L18
MVTKLEKRKRRSRKTRSKIKELEQYRLSVHRSSKHIYAQIIAPEDNAVVAAASSLDPEVRKLINEKTKGKKDVAKIVGHSIAQKAKEAKIEKVAFDRSGFLYHGRVKALAEAAREKGLNF